MSVPVYLAKLAVKNPSDHRLAKIKRLCDAVGLADKVKPLGTVGEDEVVAIKLHFGEAGNDTYLHPTFVRQVVDCVKATGDARRDNTAASGVITSTKTKLQILQ